MNETVTIWTLNNAANLLADPAVQQDVIEIFKKYGFSAVFGDRTVYNTETVKGPKSQLMPGTEYFVPVFPKCFGNILENPPDEIAYIKEYYSECRQDNYANFWSGEFRKKYSYGMLTKDMKGYYSILKETAPNVLIGYSQGGLVARYLAFIAEHFDNNKTENGKKIVKGVITISTPVYGSPLANEENLTNIIGGLCDIFSIILPFMKPSFDWIKAHASRTILYIFISIIKGIIESLPESPFRNWLLSLIDWFGGLTNDPNNAFYDLNILRLEKTYKKPVSGFDYNVLSSININCPEDIYYGSILSTNYHIGKMIDQDINDALRKITAEQIMDHIKNDAELQAKEDAAGIENAINEFTSVSTNSAETMAKTESSIDTSRIEEIYTKVVMKETYPPEKITNPVIKEVIGFHTNGVSSSDVKPDGLDPLAHDLIIPSAYQLTMAGDTILTERNIPNYNASHITGGDPSSDAGKENIDNIKTLIGKMLDSAY